MPYSISSERGYTYINLSGHLTVPEVAAAVQKMDEIDSGADATPNRLVDITAVENLQVSFSEMSNFASLRRSVKLKNPVRTAVVARTPVQFGVARMFELLNQQPQTQVAVFTDPDLARRWLAGEAEIKVRLI
jgi:hypothetical protein